MEHCILQLFMSTIHLIIVIFVSYVSSLRISLIINIKPIVIKFRKKILED